MEPMVGEDEVDEAEFNSDAGYSLKLEVCLVLTAIILTNFASG